mmetsp:Transcript_18803/g.29638  ORF Transcript_18803/g.29638 Transcript_18803/m.29638 type:complete len:464 (+) Transcript_18803:3-1394(+)
MIRSTIFVAGSLALAEHAPASTQIISSSAKMSTVQVHTRPNGAFALQRKSEQPVMRNHAHVKIDDGAVVSVLQHNVQNLSADGPDIPTSDASRLAEPGFSRTDTFASGDINYKYKLGALLVLSVGLVTLAPRLPPSCVAYVVCAVYVALSVSIDLSIASLRRHDTPGSYAFDPACCVILVEACKLASSLILLAWNHCSGTADLKDIKVTEFLKRDAWLLSLPGILFAAQNLLLFEAIGKNDMAAFGVFRETLILWTFIFWRCFFKVELGLMRTAGISIIFVGMVGNRVGATTWSWSILWVLAMTFSNASATVVNEFALKRTMGLDINVQNATLYAMCATCGVLVLAVKNPSKLFSVSDFFEGFASSTVLTVALQILAGLMVSRILKYADSVTKCVAATMRGPILVLLAPYLLHTSSDWSAILSSVVVSLGCLLYLLQGPIQTGLQKDPVVIRLLPPSTTGVQK